MTPTTPATRFALVGSPYRAPRFRYGHAVTDQARGRVVVVGLSAAPIPWPVGKRGRAKSLAVYAGLNSSNDKR
jgi:hypothetical protein